MSDDATGRRTGVDALIALDGWLAPDGDQLGAQDGAARARGRAWPPRRVAGAVRGSFARAGRALPGGARRNRGARRRAARVNKQGPSLFRVKRGTAGWGTRGL